MCPAWRTLTLHYRTHPFRGIAIDPIECIPIIIATIYVNGLPRLQAGNEGEIFMGSSTVDVAGEPFARFSVPVLSCSCIGMPAPIRARGGGPSASLMLPTSLLISIPSGKGVVLVGGPLTVSLMGLDMRAGTALGGKLFTKFVKDSPL